MGKFDDAGTIYPEQMPPKKYTAGQAIQVFSDSQQCWVAATVSAVQADGTVSVKYGNGATKDIGPVFHTKYLRPCTNTVRQTTPARNRGSDCHDPPTVIGGYGHCGRSLHNDETALTPPAS